MDGELLADQPLGEKLIKKGFWLYFFAYLIGPAGYLVRVIVSNSVSVADVGILYTILGLVGLLNVYNDLGLTESLQYFLPRYRVKKQFNYIKTSIYLSLAVQIFTAIIIALFLWLGAPWLSIHYFHSPTAVIILKYFCFYFLGINLFQVLQNIFIAFQDTFSSQFMDFIRMRSVVIFTILFFFTGKQSIERYSLNRVLGLFAGIIIASIIFYRKYRKNLLQGTIVFEKPMLKEYIKYALWSFLALNVFSLFGQAILQITIVMIGPDAAGYYTNFLSLFGITTIIIGPIMGIIFPIVSELVSKKDTKKLSLLFDFFYTYFSVFSLSLAVFFIVLGPQLALVFFGHKFVFSGTLLSRSAIFIIFNILFGFNFGVLAGLGKIKERVKILLITTVLTVIITVGAIPILGVYGAILGFSVSQLLLFILSYRILNKTTKIHIHRGFVIKNIIFISILGSIIWYIKGNIFIFDDLQRYNNLLKMIALGMCFYIVFAGFNYKKVLELKNEIRNIKKR
ncbi:MAG: oligosaccharide flippase family protein [Candidatus Absconditabacterales bacterium]